MKQHNEVEPTEPASLEGPSSPPPRLGPLEAEAMDVIWRLGSGSVRDITKRMPRKLAYTTVLTTLDRLHRKRLLKREKNDRAFIYSPAITKKEWSAKEVVASWLDTSTDLRSLLLSCLVDAVGVHGSELLDELQEKVQRKREELVNNAANEPARQPALPSRARLLK